MVLPSSFQCNTGNATHALKQLEHSTFFWWDYGAFTLMMVLSSFIGIYFGCFGNKQRTASDYIFAGKNMGIVPVIFSTIASILSSSNVLGIPAEIYFYGTQYLGEVFVIPLLGVIIVYVILPVIFKLQLRTVYQYLEYRFGPGARLFASLTQTLTQILIIPVLIYGSSLAFSQVSGVKLIYLIPSMSLICIFYSVLGGLKAVMWADTLQQGILMGSMIVMIFLGLQNVGSPKTIWEKNEMGGRLELFNMDPNPTERITFPNVFIGSTFRMMAVCLNQMMVQRYLAVSSLRKSQIVAVFFIIGFVLCKVLEGLIGMVIFAKYNECDPLTTKRINRPDQIFPFFTMDVGRSIPGFPGLFIAATFSAALSSISSYLNTASGVIFEDLISKLLPGQITEERAGQWMRGIMVVVGIISILMTIVVDKLGSIVQIVLSLFSITAGPILGLFILGMVFPWTNYKGAMIGSLSGLALSTWMVIGAQIAILKGDLRFPKKSLKIDNCDWTPINETSLNTSIYECNLSELLFDNRSTSFGTSWKSTTEASEGLFPLYMISFQLYSFIGTMTTIIVCLVASFLTGAQDPATINPDLLSPVLHRWILPPKNKRIRKCNSTTESISANNAANSSLIDDGSELRSF